MTKLWKWRKDYWLPGATKRQRKVDVAIKGQYEESRDGENVFYFGCTDVRILGVMLYYSFARCHH